MGNLQEKINRDLKEAMKQKLNDVSILRVIMGEFSRQDHKDLTDEEVTRIIQKLAKNEKEVNKFLKEKEMNTNNDLDIMERYLPKVVSVDELIKWIKENIDFSTYKNKMQSMKTIMNNFAGRVDGNDVKRILTDFF